MKVATYSRVSTSHHDQRPEIQINELRRYCGDRGWLISHELTDHGFSGSNDNRPALKQLLALARSKEIDCIVVLKLDRLFRSLKNLVVTLEEFERLGVLFVAVKDNVDYSTPSGRFFVQVLGSLAEFERSLLRERTIMGLAHARTLGKTLGRPRIHNKDQEIQKFRAEGKTYRQIRDILNIPMGTITRAIRGAQITHPVPGPSTPVPNSVVSSADSNKRMSLNKDKLSYIKD